MNDRDQQGQGQRPEPSRFRQQQRQQQQIISDLSNLITQGDRSLTMIVAAASLGPETANRILDISSSSMGRRLPTGVGLPPAAAQPAAAAAAQPPAAQPPAAAVASINRHPLGDDDRPVVARESHGYKNKALVLRPANLPLDRHLHATTINRLTKNGSRFNHHQGVRRGTTGGDGRTDERGDLVTDVRSIMSCVDCVACKAKIRQCRPIDGQGDRYIVLQTKGKHHVFCTSFDPDVNGEVVFNNNVAYAFESE